MYLAVDPGEGVTSPSIGVAKFSESGKVMDQKQMYFTEFVQYLENLRGVRFVVCEKYTIRPQTARYNTGGGLGTVQTIGALRAWCVRRGNITYTEQGANILPIATKLSGTVMPKNHAASHEVSAYLHGFYYLVKKKVIVPPTPEDDGQD